MTTATTTIARQSADCFHSTMHAELVLTELLFVAAGAVGFRTDFRVVFRVGLDMAVEARQKAVY